jgi:formylglycine-generating enzyme required for sulfatase activity
MGKESYQKGTTDFHPTYKTGEMPYTSPVGSFAANGYGLYDMTGNVLEWCWDRYGEYPSALRTDPCGATSGSNRAFRGGGWSITTDYCRVAYRNYYIPGGDDYGIGFRMARSSVP